MGGTLLKKNGMYARTHYRLPLVGPNVWKSIPFVAPILSFDVSCMVIIEELGIMYDQIV